MPSVLVYRFFILVPLVYILMIVIITKNDDVQEDTIKDQMVHYSEIGQDGEEKELLETVDNFVRDAEIDIVFVRRRHKINEKHKEP